MTRSDRPSDTTANRPGEDPASDLTYSLSSRRDAGFEVVVRNRAGRRWLAEITPTHAGDQRVDVFVMVHAPAWLADADEFLMRPIGCWVADAQDEPAQIADQVMRSCRVTSVRVA